MKQKVFKKQISQTKFENLEKIIVCPYCMSNISETYSACCGEAGHGEYAYIDYDDEDFEVITISEFEKDYEVIKDEPCIYCNHFGPNCQCEPEAISDR